MSAKDEIRLYTDHFQFYVQDIDPPGDTGARDFWTDDALKDGPAVADGIIGVLTGSQGFVRVRVEHHEDEPPLTLAEWDRVVEAGIDIRSGYLLVLGCCAFSGLFFSVLRGHYRVRCCQSNLAESIDSVEMEEKEGGDRYLVQFGLLSHQNHWYGSDGQSEQSIGSVLVLQAAVADSERRGNSTVKVSATVLLALPNAQQRKLTRFELTGLPHKRHQTVADS